MGSLIHSPSGCAYRVGTRIGSGGFGAVYEGQPCENPGDTVSDALEYDGELDQIRRRVNPVRPKSVAIKIVAGIMRHQVGSALEECRILERLQGTGRVVPLVEYWHESETTDIGDDRRRVVIVMEKADCDLTAFVDRLWADSELTDEEKWDATEWCTRECIASTLR